MNTRCLTTKVLLTLCLVSLSIASYAQNENDLNRSYTVPFGIGTNSPNGSLHVHETREIEPVMPPTPEGDSPRDSTDNTDVFLYHYKGVIRLTNPNTGVSDEDGFVISQADTDIVMRQYEDGVVKLLGTNGTGITINNTGKVGIGVEPSSSYALRVTGDSYFGHNAYVGTKLVSAYGEFSQSVQISGMAKIGSGFECSQTGLVKCKELRVTLSGWSDYVFDEGYRRMSLGELESFINQHHHLPNIPSAAEVERDGISVGDMNARLLEKVEELTLYIIELQKEIDELKTSNK